MDTKNFTQLDDRSVQNLGHNYLGCYMQVTLNDGSIRNGYLYTLDPTLGNLILIVYNNNNIDNDKNENDASNVDNNNNNKDKDDGKHKNGAIAIMHHAIEMIAGKYIHL